MATKIYGVDGQREAIMAVPLANGRNSIKLEFTRGNNNRGAYYRPATCVIADKARQDMIESSPMFKSKLIRLIKVIGTDKPVQQQEYKKPEMSKAKAAALAAEKKRREEAAKKNAETASVPEPETTNEKTVPAAEGADNGGMNFPEVTTIEQARVALKAHGANAGVLMNETAMKNYMARNGIVFPNFQF